MRVVLDTCILKLATCPGENNASALIFELARRDLIEAWASPAIFEEYADVLGDHPELVAEITDTCQVCYPLTELRVIRHDPAQRPRATGVRSARTRESVLALEPRAATCSLRRL